MMELILDTANLKEIQECNDWYNIAGITTNPTILSREKMDFYSSLLSLPFVERNWEKELLYLVL